MNLKDMFEKEFLFESKKEDKKSTKIFYKLDIRLKKKEEEKPEDQAAPVDSNAAPAVDQAPVDSNAAPAVEQPVDLSMGSETGQDAGALDSDNGMMSSPPPLDGGSEEGKTTSVPQLSVVTEDDNKEKIEVNDEENIIRKMEGEITVDKERVNDIQTIDDIISFLAEEENDGVKVLDEFSADIIQALINPATQQEVKNKVDKESKIFAEIIYGKKTDDSVGIRLIKRKNSELVTTSMLIDNKILNAAYSKDILDKRITEYRNNECGAE